MGADHIDFKKALDLLDFVNLEDEEKLNIWLHIWCRSIMKNTWTDIDKDNPLESVRDTSSSAWWSSPSCKEPISPATCPALRGFWSARSSASSDWTRTSSISSRLDTSSSRESVPSSNTSVNSEENSE